MSLNKSRVVTSRVSGSKGRRATRNENKASSPPVQKKKSTNILSALGPVGSVVGTIAQVGKELISPLASLFSAKRRLLGLRENEALPEGTVLLNIPITPQQMGNRMTVMSNLYDWFNIGPRGVKFQYKTTLPATTTGAIAGFIDPDPVDRVSVMDGSSLLKYASSMSTFKQTPVWQDAEWVCPRNPNHTAVYTSGSADVRMSAFGRFVLVCATPVTDVGNLYIEYDVQFSRPQARSVATATRVVSNPSATPLSLQFLGDTKQFPPIVQGSQETVPVQSKMDPMDNNRDFIEIPANFEGVAIYHGESKAIDCATVGFYVSGTAIATNPVLLWTPNSSAATGLCAMASVVTSSDVGYISPALADAGTEALSVSNIMLIRGLPADTMPLFAERRRRIREARRMEALGVTRDDDEKGGVIVTSPSAAAVAALPKRR